MATIRIKRSTISGTEPNLVDGELAFNLPDRKLFARDGQGNIRYIDFTSDQEKVNAGPIKQALDNKTDKNASVVNVPNTPLTENSTKAANTFYVKSLLGKTVGVDWGPFENRILITKTCNPNDLQQALDIQYNTRDGTGPTAGSVGNSVSVTTRAGPGTKYGHFGFISLLENRSTLNPGEAEFGHTALTPYVFTYNVNAAPSWAIAAEVREFHGQPNPTNGMLCAELTVIGTGTDNNNKRCALFLPANKNNPADGILTETAQGIFWKTNTNTKYKNAMYLEGEYGQILNASGVTADNLIKATGNFKRPAIDLYALSSTDSTGVNKRAAITLNAAHTLEYRSADNVMQGSLGWDGNTPAFGGVKTRNTIGGSAGYIEVNINGTRYAMPIFNLT